MGISPGGARESSPWREPWEQTRTARSPGGASRVCLRFGVSFKGPRPGGGGRKYPRARAMGTNAYGKEPRRGERTLSRGFTHRRARRAFLRPYGAGASLGRSHRAYALGYFLVPLTGLRTAHAQDRHDAKNSASRRRRGLKM